MSLNDDLATLRRCVHRGDDVFFNEAANAALDRVEAEIARLHALIEGSATDEAILQAAEADAARLRDGLRAYLHDHNGRILPELCGCECCRAARALLAEDGGA